MSFISLEMINHYSFWLENEKLKNTRSRHKSEKSLLEMMQLQTMLSKCCWAFYLRAAAKNTNCERAPSCMPIGGINPKGVGLSAGICICMHGSVEMITISVAYSTEMKLSRFANPYSLRKINGNCLTKKSCPTKIYRHSVLLKLYMRVLVFFQKRDCQFSFVNLKGGKREFLKYRYS